MTIYVVIGSTGTYEDRHNWIVGYCDTVDEAERIEKECQSHADRIQQIVIDQNLHRWNAIELYPSEYDKFFDMDYNGTTYHVEEVNRIVMNTTQQEATDA